ncbi:MAG: GlxA family transcriptional regulator [Candidatus Pelagadaptatus aseana]|uniref:GlxA family transcriptional regulator n=1 Tax=Candidatus Pelagadaptatus aseana TaxID=3120508 RepID=UPI0039B25EA4
MTTKNQPNHINRVAILAFDGSTEMSISMSRDMFYAGAIALQDKQQQPSPGDLVKVVSQNGKPVQTFSGSLSEVDGAITDIDHADLVIVSGIWRKMDEFIKQHQTTVEWLRQQHQRGAVIACMHTGAYLLAETGLLNDRTATIYWRLVDQFKARYPKVILQPEKGITSSGNLYCSSGVTSGVEMGIYLLEKMWGVSVAAKVSRHFLMDIPKAPLEFQLALEQQKNHSDEKIQQAQDWMESNFSSEFMIEEVADRMGLSMRSFRRRFRDATGESPIQYLQHIRIETAKQMLATSSLGIDQIGYRVGYQDGSYFTRLFKQKVGMTPSEFRLNEHV